MAHGGSPKGVFALGSNLTGCTSPARLGGEGCAAPSSASLAGKQRKKPETRKTWIFLIFFFYFERKTSVLERDQIDVASTMRKTLYNTEIFNDFLICA